MLTLDLNYTEIVNKMFNAIRNDKSTTTTKGGPQDVTSWQSACTAYTLNSVPAPHKLCMVHACSPSEGRRTRN